MAPQMGPSGGTGAQPSNESLQVASRANERSHLAWRGLAEAEFWLVGGHGAARRFENLFVEPCLFQADGG